MAVAGLVLLCGATGRAGPLLPPLEVDLDVARHVVLGTLTAIREKDPGPAGSVQEGTAVIAVRRTLKGPEKERLELDVAIRVAAGYGGTSPPRVRKVGDSGIWIIGAAYRSHDLLPETRLEEVERALEFLSSRRWTDPTNGLVAWVGVLHHKNDPSPWLVFAVRNVSDKVVYCPLKNVLGTAVAEGGQTLRIPGKEDWTFCRGIPPGGTEYLLSYGFAYHFQGAPPGTYTITLTFENERDGESAEPKERGVVTTWKGKLAPPPVEVVQK